MSERSDHHAELDPRRRPAFGALPGRRALPDDDLPQHDNPRAARRRLAGDGRLDAAQRDSPSGVHRAVRRRGHRRVRQRPGRLPAVPATGPAEIRTHI